MNPAAVPIGTAPVLVFLVLLVLLDSFKLVPFRSVLGSLLAGAVAAGLALAVNTWALGGFDALVVRRYLAPLVEETLKSGYVLLLFRRHRVGFVLDAAVHGFAVGAGFALVENLYYLFLRSDASLLLWVVRGLGTAVMHGSTAAMLAVVAKVGSDRRRGRSGALAGLALAVGVHAFFNHFVLHPLAMTALLLAVLSPLTLFVFGRSERATRAWLGTGFDTDLELLELIVHGDVRATRVGAYLQELRARFAPTVVADMLCFLRIYLELAMRAKSQLIAREAGLELDIGDDVVANLEELRYLEKSIGKTGKRALHPFLGAGSRDLWQLAMLRQRYSMPNKSSSPA